MKRYKIILLLLLIAGAVFVVYQQRTAPYRHCEGKIFGTWYNITYQHDKDIHKEILEALNSVDSSLSMFNMESTISKINRGENPDLDRQMLYILPRAKKVSEATGGAFDITVAPLVNVWGFGFKHEEWPSQHTIDSIKAFVGYEKIRVNKRKLEKNDSRTMIDLSAIAKGYGADVVGQVLDNNKVRNYMVEIGGDMVVKGKNSNGDPWRIGVAKPTDEKTEQQEYQCVLNLSDCAVATSGNYRNFFYKDGVKYAHTIDPKTGYPVQHDILSATIIAPHCYEADAYATASMVLGVENAKKMLSKQQHLDAYLIYIDTDGEQKVWMTNRCKKYIK